MKDKRKEKNDENSKKLIINTLHVVFILIFKPCI